MFIGASGCDRQNITPVVKWTFDKDPGDTCIVDEKAGAKTINSLVVFVT